MPESVRLSAQTAKSSISRCSPCVAWPTMAGSATMAKPISRASPRVASAGQDGAAPRRGRAGGRVEQLGVLALHVLDELAAQQHGAMLALHQGREAPAAHTAVELDAVGLRQTVPEARAMDVDEIVGDQPAIALERHRPVDVAGGVPLIDLGLLIEPAQVRLVAAVVVAEVCGVARLDLVPVVHNVPPYRF